MPTTTVETTCSAVKSTTGAATVAAPWTARKTAPTVGCGAATVTPASPPVIPAIPRPGAQERPTDKPVRPVVAVRRTGVWWRSVVAVVAYWRSGNVSRPESDPNTDLGLGLGQRNHQNYQQGHIP